MLHSFGTRLRHARLGRVLVVYGSASFGVLQGADILTARLALPDWLFTGTLIIAIVALPIVLATALVYGSRRAAERAGPEPAPHVESASLAPAAEPPATAAAGPSGGSPAVRPVLTWRRSTAAIAAAFALLMLSTGGFMAMRHLGIGPAGTLLARGVLDARDPLIIAEFESGPADSALARVVTDAFRIDFSHSPSITVLQPQQLQQTLQLMNIAAGTRLGTALAAEVAQRRGVKAVVTGELTSAGAGYLLTARLVTADSGIVLAAHRESAASADALIPAIDRLSKKLRERIGESLRTIRAEPLAQVTTGSLEALRYYTQGSRAFDIEGDHERALALLENAVRADSAFAMAHRKTGIILMNRSLGYERAVRAFESAYQHRERLSARERHLTEAAYFSYVTSEPQKSIAAYRMVLSLDPDNETALNNLAIQLMAVDELDEAESLLRRALVLDSGSVSRYINLANAQFRLGRDDDVATTLALMRSRFGDLPQYEQHAALVAAALFDYERFSDHLERLATVGRGSAAWRSSATSLRVSSMLLHGRFAEAERLAAAAMRDVPGVSPEAVPLMIAMGRAQVGALRGDRQAADAAAAALDEALRRTPLESLSPYEQPLLGLAQTYALLGRPATARDLVDRFDRTAPDQLRQAASVGQRLAGAEIALAERRFDDALRALESIGDEYTCRICLDATRGRIFDAAGRADSAIAAGERYLAIREIGRIGHDAGDLPRTYERLGRLYDQGGNAERARYYYARFIALWEDADADLQPRVHAARQRLAALLQA